jgi:hypothetical protein
MCNDPIKKNHDSTSILEKKENAFVCFVSLALCVHLHFDLKHASPLCVKFFFSDEIGNFHSTLHTPHVKFLKSAKKRLPSSS